MKKFNKRVLTICTSALCLSSIASINAGAVAVCNSSLDKFKDLQERSFKVSEDYDDRLEFIFGSGKDFYVTEDEDVDSRVYVVDEIAPSHLVIEIRGNANTPQKIENIISKVADPVYTGNKICSDGSVIHFYEFYNFSQSITDKLLNRQDLLYSPEMLGTEEFNSGCLSEGQAKAIYSSLVNNGYKDSLVSVKYYGVGVHILPGVLERPYYFYLSKEKQEILKSYISENSIDYSLSVENPDADYSYTRITPNGDVTLEEHYKLLNDIYVDTGLYNWTNDIPLGSNNSFSGDAVDVLNAVDGDANDDGILSIADAVTIMQSVGNPDEYALTPQGEFNADIAGDYDGVTNMDALAVQRKLIHLE